MGRPLNKRFFGNRNIGANGDTNSAKDGNGNIIGLGGDDGIGGQGLASVTNATVGAIQINDTYKTFPGLTVAGPELPGGVTATTAVVWEVATVSLAGGTGYTAGTITSITGLDTFGTTDTRFTITVDGGGVPTFGTFTERGSYTSIDGTGITTWAVVGPAGDGAAQATVTFRIKSIGVSQKGSGYTGLPSLSWSQVNGGTMPSGQTPALTVDTGALNGTNASTNQQNAIIAYAMTVSEGTNLIADIKKQVSGRRYQVTTSEGTAICKLVTDGVANAVGEMTITATDSNGNTYYVSKLTRHKATLVRLVDDGGDADWLYATGGVAPWGFAAAADLVVQIANA